MSPGNAPGVTGTSSLRGGRHRKSELLIHIERQLAFEAFLGWLASLSFKRLLRQNRRTAATLASKGYL